MQAPANGNSPAAPMPPSPAPLKGAALALLTFATALATFMEILDITIANVSVPTIAGALGVSTSQGTWIISAYSVAAAIAVPLTGWLARRVGEVKLFVISVLAFTLMSTLAAFSVNLPMLVAFRLLQGAERLGLGLFQVKSVPHPFGDQQLVLSSL